VAQAPTLYISCSDQHRNGKTFLARLLVDYLMLDGRDPFAIDTDAPDGPLRSYFPGRTALADFSQISGQMKVFDTALASPGRDYVIDLPVRHMEPFFKAVAELDFFEEAHRAGFRVMVYYIVDRSATSLKAARAIQEFPGIDMFVAVANEFVGTSWPRDEGCLVLPELPRNLAIAISDKRISLRSFVLGDRQNLPENQINMLNSFLSQTLANLANIEPIFTLKQLTE
jgi:hypothetical protein